MVCTSQVSDLEYCDVFSLTIFFFCFTGSVCVQTPINSQLTSSGASARSTMLASSESFRLSVSCEFISMHALKAKVNHTNCTTLLYSFTDSRTCLFNLCQIEEDKIGRNHSLKRAIGTLKC